MKFIKRSAINYYLFPLNFIILLICVISVKFFREFLWLNLSNAPSLNNSLGYGFMKLVESLEIDWLTMKIRNGSKNLLFLFWAKSLQYHSPNKMSLKILFCGLILWKLIWEWLSMKKEKLKKLPNKLMKNKMTIITPQMTKWISSFLSRQFSIFSESPEFLDSHEE